jgi:hypothetical protein
MNTAAELVALETAMRDLARLYEHARRFTALRARAEADLLPRLNALGRQLRHELRGGEIGPTAIAAVATELHTMTEQWQAAIEALRTSRVVADAVAAYRCDDQPALAVALPHVFADLHPVPERPPVLYLSIPVVPARAHRANRRPLADAHEVAERVARLCGGIAPAARSDTWWDAAFPAIVLGDDPTAAESSICLALDLSGATVTVFSESEAPPLCVYTPRLIVPFHAVVAGEAGDEWWAVSAQPYEQFRDAVRSELQRNRIAVH